MEPGRHFLEPDCNVLEPGRNALEPGDRFTKVIVNRKSKITLKISLRARFTKLVLILKVMTYDLR